MSTINSKQLRKRPVLPHVGSETTLVTHTLNMLKMVVQDGMFWRNNAGMIPTATGGVVRLAPAGTADIVGIIGPLGLFVALEAKVPSRRGNVSKLQKQWLRQVESLGGYAAVFCSMDEALQHVLNARELQAKKLEGIFSKTSSGSE